MVLVGLVNILWYQVGSAFPWATLSHAWDCKNVSKQDLVCKHSREKNTKLAYTRMEDG